MRLIPAKEMLSRLQEGSEVACMSNKEERMKQMNQAKEEWEAPVEKCMVDEATMAIFELLKIQWFLRCSGFFACFNSAYMDANF